MTSVNANMDSTVNVLRQILRENDEHEAPCHAVFKFLNPLLLGTIVLKYQGKNSDPFQTHPINMWIYISATCAYYLLIGTIDQMKDHPINYQDELTTAALISGALSSFALVSILLPLLLGRLVFVLWALLAIIIARRLFICFWRLIKDGSNHIYKAKAITSKSTEEKNHAIQKDSMLPLELIWAKAITSKSTEEKNHAIQKDSMLPQELFNEESGIHVEECKLRVNYVAPPQPPSPVREGSEEGSSPRASISDNAAENFSDFNVASNLRVSRAHTEPQENSAEAKAIISKLTEEKNRAIQQSTKLH